MYKKCKTKQNVEAKLFKVGLKCFFSAYIAAV